MGMKIVEVQSNFSTKTKMLDDKPGGEAATLFGSDGVASRREAILSSPRQSEGFRRLSAVGNIRGRGAMWEMESRGLRLHFPTLHSPPTHAHPVFRMHTCVASNLNGTKRRQKVLNASLLKVDKIISVIYSFCRAKYRTGAEALVGKQHTKSYTNYTSGPSIMKFYICVCVFEM